VVLFLRAAFNVMCQISGGGRGGRIQEEGIGGGEEGRQCRVGDQGGGRAGSSFISDGERRELNEEGQH
jgi:hypothetical protein